jgi:hypothetical protein
VNDWIYAISNLLDKQTELEKTPQGLGDLEIDWCIISTMVRMGKSPDGPSFRPKPDEMHVICQVFSIESVGDFTQTFQFTQEHRSFFNANDPPQNSSTKTTNCSEVLQ